MAGEATAQSNSNETGKAVCPLCGDSLSLQPHGRLYGITVCDECRRMFARQRILASLIDGLIAYAFIWLLAFADWVIDDVSLSQYLRYSGLIMSVLLILRDGVGGQSPGKRCFDLQAVHMESGRAIGFGSSALRNLPLLFWVFALFMLAELRSGPRIGDGMAKPKSSGVGIATRPPSCRRKDIATNADTT